jgi:hypothetical protein
MPTNNTPATRQSPQPAGITTPRGATQCACTQLATTTGGHVCLRALFLRLRPCLHQQTRQPCQNETRGARQGPCSCETCHPSASRTCNTTTRLKERSYKHAHAPTIWKKWTNTRPVQNRKRSFTHTHTRARTHTHTRTPVRQTQMGTEKEQ